MIPSIVENFEAIVAIVGSVVAIIHIWTQSAKQMRESGKFDLEKTMQAVSATSAQLKKLKEEGHIESAKEVADKAVELVEKYRGKKVSPKMANKAAHSALSDLNMIHDDVAPKEK